MCFEHLLSRVFKFLKNVDILTVPKKIGLKKIDILSIISIYCRLSAVFIN